MLSSINSTMMKIWRKMTRKAYRDAFVSSHVSETVASQIALLRLKRGWTQKQLAEATGMKQSRISALEDPNYQNYEIGTLKRVASAFDVGLAVRFTPFSEIARWSATIGLNKRQVPSFEEEEQASALSAWVVHIQLHGEARQEYVRISNAAAGTSNKPIELMLPASNYQVGGAGEQHHVN